MGFWFPNKNNNKIGIGHWLKVAILLFGTAMLTYYAKFGARTPRIARVHGATAWVMPTPRGLAALVVLPDDGNYANDSATGLRIWLNPPRQPEVLENENHIRYRGPQMVLVGDSLPLATLSQIAATVDTGGTIWVLGHNFWPENMLASTAAHLQFEHFNKDSATFDWLRHWVGRDVDLQLQFTADSTDHLAPLLDFAWGGYRTRWWPNAAAAAQDSLADSLAVGVILQCLDSLTAVPHGHNTKVRTLIFCGGASAGLDSSRFNLNVDGLGAAFIDDPNRQQLLVRKMHLKWKIAEH